MKQKIYDRIRLLRIDLYRENEKTNPEFELRYGAGKPLPSKIERELLNFLNKRNSLYDLDFTGVELTTSNHQNISKPTGEYSCNFLIFAREKGSKDIAFDIRCFYVLVKGLFPNNPNQENITFENVAVKHAKPLVK